MNETTTPIPVGTVVDYHGSFAHGRYVITRHDMPGVAGNTPGSDGLIPVSTLNAAELAVAYPDGVAYEIWPEGMLQKFGNRMYMCHQVRRQSITPVTDPLRQVGQATP